MTLDHEPTNDEALIDWLRARGGVVTLREMCRIAHRPIRGKEMAEAAIASLLTHGVIEEVSPRPLTFRLVESVTTGEAGLNAESVTTCESVITPETVAAPPAETVTTQSVTTETVTKGRRCACGGHATIGTGWFLRDNANAVWRCASCDREARGGKRIVRGEL